MEALKIPSFKSKCNGQNKAVKSCIISSSERNLVETNENVFSKSKSEYISSAKQNPLTYNVQNAHDKLLNYYWD